MMEKGLIVESDDGIIDDIYIAGTAVSSARLLWQFAQEWNPEHGSFYLSTTEKQGPGTLGFAFSEEVGYSGPEHVVNLYGPLMEHQHGIKSVSLVNPAVAKIMQLPLEPDAHRDEMGAYIENYAPDEIPRGGYQDYPLNSAICAVKENSGDLSVRYNTETKNAFYDHSELLWNITETDLERGQSQRCQARHFVIATGHGEENVPASMRPIIGARNVYSGRTGKKGVYARLARLHEEKDRENRQDRSVGVAGTGLMGLDVARTYAALHSHGDLPNNFILFSRHANLHLLPQHVPFEEAEPIRGEILEIQKKLNYEKVFAAAVNHPTPQALDTIKTAFLEATAVPHADFAKQVIPVS